MPAFRFEQFVSAPSEAGLHTELAHLPAFPESLSGCLLMGPERSGRTTMLFHYAVSVAATSGPVLFICIQSKVEEVPPLLPQGLQSSDTVLHDVHMKYLQTEAELQQYAACLHLLHFPPHAIVVDDLSAFAGNRSLDKRAQDAAKMKTLALLHEAAAHYRAPLIVSDIGTSEGHASQYLLARWLPVLLRINETPVGFSLSLLPSAATDSLELPHGCWSQLAYTMQGQTGILLQSILP